jgi:uncharacterized membrane protein YkvA (DUF1232 family)
MMSHQFVTPKLDSLYGLLKLHHSMRLFTALFVDRRISPFIKLAAVSGVIYKFSPLDVEPDGITGVSLLDDIIVSLIIVQAFIELAPDHVIDEKCEQLGIDRARAFVDVPQTIDDARELYRLARRYGISPGSRTGFRVPQAGPAYRSSAAQHAPDTQSGETGEYRPEEIPEKPRFSGYSAFNADD